MNGHITTALYDRVLVVSGQQMISLFHGDTPL
jgi:hypothetical protein